MSDPAITERQQFWLKHFQAAEEFDGSLAAYARSAGLKPKEVYQWKTILVRRGLLAGSPEPVTTAPTAKPSDFVRGTRLGLISLITSNSSTIRGSWRNLASLRPHIETVENETKQ